MLPEHACGTYSHNHITILFLTLALVLFPRGCGGVCGGVACGFFGMQYIRYKKRGITEMRQLEILITKK